MSLLELSGPRGMLELKNTRLKQVAAAIEEYLQTKRDDTAMTINVHLQSLSAIVDVSIFDPNNNFASQFFVTLYELMNKMEERSVFAWSCVDVLSNACKNPAARSALIHTYQFIPSLSRLLSSHLVQEKRTRLLRLMQDLTCGIKISWQIPHLRHLMVTLSQWIVESPNPDIVALSLGVIVNLCYKNLPAFYTFSSSVDVKKIVYASTAIETPTVAIHACKLMVILDYGEKIPVALQEKIIQTTFKSIIEAFHSRDSILLRQIIEFFLDIGGQNKLEHIKDNQVHSADLEELLRIMENNESMETNDNALDTRDPDCTALIFEFVNFLIEIKLAVTVKTFPVIIKLALKWIHTDVVSSQALATLRSVAVAVDQSGNEMLEPLIQGLPVFLMTLNNWRGDQGGMGFMEQNKKVAALLQLLRAMILVPTIRARVAKELNLETICKVFGTLLGEGDSPRAGPPAADAANLDNINLYIHGIALVSELAKHDLSWLNFQNSLMKHKQIHMVVARSLYESSADEKNIVLEICRNKDCPLADIASAMEQLQPSVLDQNKSTTKLEEVNLPVLSFTQAQRIDSVLTKISNFFSEKNESSILTSDVIELYEYKLAAMGNIERSSLASLEAASERCTHLQHRCQQFSAELNRVHQLFYHQQQKYEQTSKLKDELSVTVENLRSQLSGDACQIKAYKSQLAVKAEEVGELQQELSDIKKRFEKEKETRKDLEGQREQLKKLVAKLEDSGAKLDKSLQKKEEALKKANQTNAKLVEQNTDLERNVKKTQLELQHKVIELGELAKEYQAKKQILDTITKYAITSQSGDMNLRLDET